MIQQAVILAAGDGSRLRSHGNTVPKPLHKMAGLSLIKRNLLTAQKAGIQEFIVVLGYEGNQIRAELMEDPSIQAKLHFVDNPQWKKSNGVSLLAARPWIKGDFLLMMADHVFVPEAIQEMRELDLRHTQLFLGVDRDLQSLFDIPDATKVKIGSEAEILGLGKELKKYGAYDTGLFACSQEIFNVFEKMFIQKGDVSLTEGVKALAQLGLAKIKDLTGYFWQDIDTPEALHFTEKKLYKLLAKPTDGWIAKNINRRISLVFTRWLLKTGLSASHVTGLVTLIGIFSGVFVSSGRYPGVLIGGILFNLASILDGCDGEMARLKFTVSKAGEWLDTLSDNLTYIAFFIGIAVGVYRQHPSPQVMVEATMMFIGIGLSLGIMFFYLLRYTNRGSLVAVQSDLEEEEEKQTVTGISAWITKFKFMMKRDFFAMFFMALAILNQLQLILYLAIIGANLTWIVVLIYKREIFKIPDPETVKVQR